MYYSPSNRLDELMNLTEIFEEYYIAEDRVAFEKEDAVNFHLISL